MDWKNVQRDFIERTLKLLWQYDTYLNSKLNNQIDFEELEVTLLINCLTGLLVFPYEYAARDKKTGSAQICQDDTITLLNLDKKWGLQNTKIEFISDFDQKIVNPPLNASLRIFIYRMRNSISHSRFFAAANIQSEGVGVIYNNTKYDQDKSKIEKLVFQDINNRFKAIISVEALRQFAGTLANEILIFNSR